MNRLRKGTMSGGPEAHARTASISGYKVQQKQTTGAGLLEEIANKR
jgi:hypothetical protein